MTLENFRFLLLGNYRLSSYAEFIDFNDGPSMMAKTMI